MLKRAAVLILSTTAVGCVSSAPISYSSTTPKPLDATYACALSKMNELGYTLTNTNKDAGFIQGVHQTSSGFSEFLTSKKQSDQLTVSIFDASGGGKTLRVTAASIEQTTGGLFAKSSESGKAPSEGAQSQAMTIVSTCAGSPVTKTSSSTYIRVEAVVGQ